MNRQKRQGLALSDSTNQHTCYVEVSAFTEGGRAQNPTRDRRGEGSVF